MPELAGAFLRKLKDQTMYSPHKKWAMHDYIKNKDTSKATESKQSEKPYVLLSALSENGLEKLVAEFIERGYRPLGGAFAYTNYSVPYNRTGPFRQEHQVANTMLAQSMVLINE